jgi:hypothetical protein
MQVGSKNMRIFIDGSVLYDHLVTILNFNDLLESVIQEIHLQVERPAGHILIKIVEIRIILNIFKSGLPVVMPGQ